MKTLSHLPFLIVAAAFMLLAGLARLVPNKNLPEVMSK